MNINAIATIVRPTIPESIYSELHATGVLAAAAAVVIVFNIVYLLCINFKL